MEFLYELLGYRKPSIPLGASTKSVKFSQVPRRKLNEKDWIDLSPNEHKDQGTVGSCACVTPCAQTEDIVISDTKNNLFEIPWKPVWEQMKAMGLADDNKGSYLMDNLWYLQNIGYVARDGSRWVIDKVERISYDQVEEFVRMGYQIYTGAMCGHPMCDKNHVFRTGQRKFGHAFRIIGLDAKRGMYICETTWKNYGYKKSSQFFFPMDKTNKLMSKYVFTIKQL